MNITAEKRAKALVALLKSDFGQSGDDVWFYAIRDELWAYANAAVEAAAKLADEHKNCSGSHIASLIRAMREEGSP